MKRSILLLLLCVVLFFYVNMLIYNVSSEEVTALKVSNELRTTLSNLAPNDILLLWLDVYIPPLPDGNIYLSSSDISPLIDLGAKIAGVTFSPNMQLLWYLVEARAVQVSSLANLPMVRNVSLAMIGVWDWWDEPWRGVTSVDPLLSMAAQRVARDFANASVHAVVNYDVAPNQTGKSKQEISDEISALVESVSGKVVRTELAEYVLTEVPPNELSRLFENAYVRTLEALRPIYLRGGSFRKSTSYHSQSPLFMLLVPLGVVGYSMQKRRKLKSILIVLLTFTGFLLSYNIPSTYALNVSRPAIRADQTGYTGDGVVVAVIDTGIDFNNQYLAPAILHQVDITGGNDFMDYRGHGTHVAGIVASQSGTYPGIAPGSSIINVKVGGYWTLIRDAIQWCIDNKAVFNIRAIQLSVGDPTEQPGDGTDPLSMKADEAVEAGISVVVAVMDQDTNGNGIYELSNPEQAFNVIAVGAVNDQNTVSIDDDTLAYYSSGNSTTDGRPKPDVVAPGDRTDDPLVGIWSTRSAQAPAGNYEAVNGDYARDSGTSQAAPHVSGTVALMLEANPNLTPAQVKAILRQTARLNDNLSGDARAGHGIVDALVAVQLAPSAPTLHLVIPTENLYGCHDIAAAIKEELAKIGIYTIMEYRDAATINNTVWETGLGGAKPWEAPGEGWDMAWYEFSGGPEDLMSYYLSNATRYLGNNIMPWLNKRADELLIGGMNCIEAKTRQRYLWVWQEEFMHDPPCVIIYYPSDSMCARGIAFNLNHPVLSNRYVRLAIADAIPYGEISKILSDHEIEVAGRIGWGVPIHPCTNYTDPDGVTVRLFNMKLDPYEYNLAKAQMYLDMWFYSQTGTDYTKGPVGDANFDGKVNLDDLFLLIDKWGETPPYPIDWWPPEGWKGPEVYPWPVTEGASVAPGNDIDIDFDNDGDTADPDDFLWWLYNWGKEYPFPGASPVEPLGSVEYPAIYVEPAAIEDKTYKPGTNFTVSIWTNYTGSDVWGYEFTLSWNPFILNCTEVVNGNLIVNDTYTATFRAGKIDNNAGKLHLSGCYFDVEVGEPVPTTSGPGILANVTFTVVGHGDSGILFGDETRLIGVTEAGSGTEYHIVDAFTMPDHIQNGYLCNVKPQPTHDLAVTTVTTYPAKVRVGEFVNVTVDVKNQGTATEMFEVKVYYDFIHPNWLIGTETGIILDAKLSVSLTFTWNTAGVRAGNHTIKAVASTVMGETDTDDNTKIDGTVTIQSSAPAMHVESISFSTAWKGRTQTLYITVIIFDQNGAAVSGATVTGTLTLPSGSTEPPYSDVTDTDGIVTFKYSKKKSALPLGTYTFTVTNVEKTGWTYDSDANVETSDTFTA
jgi:subtilisin family serine protease